MKALMITAQDFDDGEVLYPLYRLYEAGIEVDIASFTPGFIGGKHFFSVNAGKGVGETTGREYGLLVLPGGKAPEKLRQNTAVLDIVREFFHHDKPVAAICHGQQILISAGVLQGRKATCYPGIRDDMLLAGAQYLDERVVVDGQLVTSRRPEDLPYFMREVLGLLGYAWK